MSDKHDRTGDKGAGDYTGELLKAQATPPSTAALPSHSEKTLWVPEANASPSPVPQGCYHST